MSDDAFRSVTSNEIFSAYRFRVPGTPFKCCGYVVFILREIDEFRVPFNIPTSRLYEVIKKFFVITLLDKEKKRIGAHPFSNVF